MSNFLINGTPETLLEIGHIYSHLTSTRGTPTNRFFDFVEKSIWEGREDFQSDTPTNEKIFGF